MSRAECIGDMSDAELALEIAAYAGYVRALRAEQVRRRPRLRLVASDGRMVRT